MSDASSANSVALHSQDTLHLSELPEDEFSKLLETKHSVEEVTAFFASLDDGGAAVFLRALKTAALPPPPRTPPLPPHGLNQLMSGKMDDQSSR